MNGEIDRDTRYRAYLFGALPQIHFSSSAEEEAQWILEEIKKLENSGMLDQNICLTTYSRTVSLPTSSDRWGAGPVEQSAIRKDGSAAGSTWASPRP